MQVKKVLFLSHAHEFAHVLLVIYKTENRNGTSKRLTRHKANGTKSSRCHFVTFFTELLYNNFFQL